jgi:hypothetical protein
MRLPWSFSGLYDVGLTLSVERRVVGNEANADGRANVQIGGRRAVADELWRRSLSQNLLRGEQAIRSETTNESAGSRRL